MTKAKDITKEELAEIKEKIKEIVNYREEVIINVDEKNILEEIKKHNVTIMFKKKNVIVSLYRDPFSRADEKRFFVMIHLENYSSHNVIEIDDNGIKVDEKEVEKFKKDFDVFYPTYKMLEELEYKVRIHGRPIKFDVNVGEILSESKISNVPKIHKLDNNERLMLYTIITKFFDSTKVSVIGSSIYRDFVFGVATRGKYEIFDDQIVKYNGE